MTEHDKKKLGELFSKRLQETIKEKGLPEEWIVERAKISLKDYKSIKSGDIFSYDVYAIASIAYVLDISLDYLMGWSDEKRPSNQNEQLNKYDINNPEQKAERKILHYLSLLDEREQKDFLSQIEKLINNTD